MIEVLTVALVAANLLLVLVICKQVRLAHKPIITTKVISREKDVDATASVLETGVLYLVISNVSNNIASNLRIHWDFLLGNEKITGVSKVLKYLNPGEAVKELLELGKIIREHPELFDEVQRGDEIKKIPKKTLRLSLNVTVTYNFPKHKIYDSYEIEWGSLENYPTFKDHPTILSYNRRDGLYIYKLGEKQSAGTGKIITTK